MEAKITYLMEETKRKMEAKVQSVSKGEGGGATERGRWKGNG